VVPSTQLPEYDEEEEVVEVTLGKQELAEQLDLVVACLEVVEGVEKTKDEVVQRGVYTVL
jgi:hypothetical protein